jgi:hypothetical protein
MAAGVRHEGAAVGVMAEGDEQRRVLMDLEARRRLLDAGDDQTVGGGDRSPLLRGEPDPGLQRDERRLVSHPQ